VVHEERFGVVKRPDSQKPDTVSNFVRLSDKSFAMEYSRWINKKDDSLLVQFQEGNVYDETGKELKHSTTNKPLRSIRRWYDNQNNSLAIEVDEDLNISMSNSAVARDTVLKLGAQNKLDLSGKQLKMTMLTTGAMNFFQSFQLTSPQISLAGNVTMGPPGAAAPLVMGDKLNNQTLKPFLLTVSSTFRTLAATPTIAVSAPTVAALNAAAVFLDVLVVNLSLSLTKSVKAG